MEKAQIWKRAYNNQLWQFIYLCLKIKMAGEHTLAEPKVKVTP